MKGTVLQKTHKTPTSHKLGTILKIRNMKHLVYGTGRKTGGVRPIGNGATAIYHTLRRNGH